MPRLDRLSFSMLRACSCVVALTATVTCDFVTSQAADTTLTLACQGTASSGVEDAKPQQITMRIIVDFSVRTVAGFTYPALEEFPVMVRDANEVHITFAGSNESGSSIVAGDINRVTGELWANSTVRDAQTRKIVMWTSYSLKCRPG